MELKEFLAKAIEIVSFLLAAFGGFLTNIAPPQEVKAQFAVGIASFATLIIFLTIAVLSRRRLTKRHEKIWLWVSAALAVGFLAAAFTYKRNFERWTFLFPLEDPAPERYMGGTFMTQKADERKKAHPNENSSVLVANFGALPARTSVWPQEAIDSASLYLTINYVLVVICAAGAIFCLTEGILLRIKAGQRRAERVPPVAGRRPAARPRKKKQKK